MPEEHRVYLADRPRLDAFRRALEAVVRPGAVVLDLGSGTGVLGMMACRAGAARVHAVDEGPILEVAARVARDNGFGDRFLPLRGMSTRLELPERVDVVVADLIGGFGFEAGLVDYFADARDRFLKPGGVLVPRAVAVEIAPVEHGELHGEVAFWGGRPADLDFSAFREAASHTPGWAKIPAAALLGDPVPFAAVDLAVAEPGPLAADLVLPITRDGTLHGLGGWFRATLAPGVAMSTSPRDPERVDRRNVFLPLPDPVPVAAGDRVEARLSYVPSQFLVAWSGRVAAADGTERAAFDQSTFHSAFFTREDLHRRLARFVPRPDRWGEAWRRAVALCDGTRPVGSVRAALAEEFPGLFRSPADLESFVADAVASVLPRGPTGTIPAGG